MNYAIAVHGVPYSSLAHQHALSFAAQALKMGHTLSRVFFYHDAVQVASIAQVPPEDEIDLRSQWIDLAQTHQVELAVCIANGLKRGIVSKAEAERYELGSHTLEHPFELVGLGQLIDAINNSDQYIEFPA